VRPRRAHYGFTADRVAGDGPITYRKRHRGRQLNVYVEPDDFGGWRVRAELIEGGDLRRNRFRGGDVLGEEVVAAAGTREGAYRRALEYMETAGRDLY
jgi:hypothetical protein